MQKEHKWIFLLLFAVVLVFFYQIFLSKVPFPGDLLVSTYNPWKYDSILGYAPGGFPNKAQYFDTIRQIYPWTTAVVNSIKNGQFPLWNPYNFSGAPLFANSQSAVLYPLHLLYFVFPQVIAWTILVLLQPFLTSIFTYAFARKIGIGKLGSLLSSIAFSYSLFTTVFLEYNTLGHVILFLPLLLLLTEYLLIKRTFWKTVSFSLAIAMAACAGHIQIFGFVVLFIFLYILFRILTLENLQRKGRVLLYFSLLFLLGFGIAAVQLLPTFELIQHAARVPQDYRFLVDGLLIQPYQPLLLISPDIFGNPATRNYLLSDSYPGNALYIGLIPLIFSLTALFTLKKNILVRFLFGISIGLLVFFVNSPFTQLFYRVHIPFFSTGSPTNAIFLLSFSLSILAGIGMEYSYLSQKKGTLISAIGVGSIFFIGILLYKVFHISFIMKNVLYSTGLLLSTVVLFIAAQKMPKKKTVIYILLIAMTTIDLFYFFQKFNPFVSKSLVFPSNDVITFLQEKGGLNRFWSYGGAYIEPNFATQYHLFDVNGYDPLYPKEYGALLQSSARGTISETFTNRTRSDAVVAQGFGTTDFATNPYRKKVLNLLGAKYIIDRTENNTTTETFPPDQYMLIYNKNGWKILENKSALPRAFVAFSYQKFSSDQEFGNKFYSDTFDIRSTILINNALSPLSAGSGSAQIISYTPAKVTINTDTTGNGLLFLSDTYYPGWKAYVDGKQTPIYRADFAFRAIALPSGKHMVAFTYTPSSFSLGLTLTIISIGFVLSFGLAGKKMYE